MRTVISRHHGRHAKRRPLTPADWFLIAGTAATVAFLLAVMAVTS